MNESCTVLNHNKIRLSGEKHEGKGPGLVLPSGARDVVLVDDPRTRKARSPVIPDSRGKDDHVSPFISW